MSNYYTWTFTSEFPRKIQRDQQAMSDYYDWMYTPKFIQKVLTL